MDKENEQAPVVEETREPEETTEDTAPQGQNQEETVSISKDKFKSMQRKAMAYDANKKSKPLPTREPIDEDVSQRVNKLEMLEQKRQFGYENNLSPDETDFVFRFAGNKPSKEILANPFVKSGLEGYRASKRVETNTPSSSSGSKIFKEKEFKEMSEEERRKSFEEASKKFRG